MLLQNNKPRPPTMCEVIPETRDLDKILSAKPHPIFNPETHFQSKDYDVFQDQNNSTYAASQPIYYDTLNPPFMTDQIMYDLWGSFIALNMSVSASAVGGGTAAAGVPTGPFVTLKGAHHLIDAIRIDLGSSNMVQNVAESNLYNNYRLIKQWNDTHVKSSGAQFWYSPPNFEAAAAQQAYDGASKLTLPGVANNQLVPTATNIVAGGYATGTKFLPPTWNQGGWNRLKWASFPNAYPSTQTSVTPSTLLSTTTTPPASGGNNGWRNDQNGWNSTSFYWPAGALTTATTYVAAPDFQTMWVCIPLPILHDWFRAVAFLNQRLQLQVYPNIVASTSSTLTNGATGTTNTLNYPVARMTCGTTCPIIIDAQAIMGGSATKIASTASFSTRIIGPTFLYMHKVVLTPAQASTVVSKQYAGPIAYRNWQIQRLLNQTGAQQITWQITPGVRNLRKLIIYAFPSTTGNLGNVAASAYGGGSWVGGDVRLSAIGEEPSYSTPGFALENLAVYVGGTQISQRPTRFAFEEYFNYIVPNVIGQGDDPQDGSSFFNKELYETAGIHVIDFLQAGMTEAQLNNTSIQVNAKLITPCNNTINMDLIAILEYEDTCVVLKTRPGAVHDAGP